MQQVWFMDILQNSNIRFNNKCSILQTYGFKNKKTGEIEVYTYVDYVDLNGPASIAGMRRGN